MNAQEILTLTSKLIEFRSLSGAEGGVVEFLAEFFAQKGWSFERLAVVNGRENLFVTWGTPKVVFTTHVDVVPAPESLFIPRVEGEKLFGRGACDAKGIAATMTGVVNNLSKASAKDFGLLIVVGEEDDGIGAQIAAKTLAGRGIQFLINGEPTEGKLMRAHKGGLGLAISFPGRSVHSGYPDLGVDANLAMVEAAARLYNADFGSDQQLGATTVNIGVMSGGSAANIVSSSARMRALFRTVVPNSDVLRRVNEIIPKDATIEIEYDVEAVNLVTVPGFESDVASYCTDVPFFAPLGAQALLYGPGSIHRAHTDFEYITLGEIEEAQRGYHRLFELLGNMTR